MPFVDEDDYLAWLLTIGLIYCGPIYVLLLDDKAYVLSKPCVSCSVFHPPPQFSHLLSLLCSKKLKK